MIGHTEYLLGTETLQSACSHAGKSLRRSHFMTIQAVDIQLRRPVFNDLNNMLVPNFVEQRIHILVSKFVDTVYIGLHTGRNNVGICTETIVNMAIVLHLHVHFAHVVRAFVYRLNGKFFQ